jgi:hypothetical protein
VIKMDVADTRELTQLARKLRRAGDGRTGTLARRRLVTATPAVVRRVQSAVRAVEVGSTRGGVAYPDRSTNLRGRVAAATEHAPIAIGVAIYVAGWKLGVNGTRLAQYLDTEDLPRWKVPVFRTEARVAADKVKWVQQTGQPYFYVTIRAAEPRYEAAVEAAMATIAREICS